MSGKNQYPVTFNWQATDPSVGFKPTPAINGGGSAPSGILTGTMASTNTIYSQIIDISRMDNCSLDVSWTGTPTGTFAVLVSNSGNSPFSALTFSPSLGQPSGSAAFMTVSLNQLPYKFLCLRYANASGSGVLSVTGQQKDLN